MTTAVQTKAEKDAEIAEMGVLPRILKPTDRAVKGTARFKVGCANYGKPQSEYILCRDAVTEKAATVPPAHPAPPVDKAPVVDKAEDEARAFYLKHVGLDKVMARLEKNRGKDGPAIEQPDLTVTRLPD